jgi:phosphoribosylglycinamide formyltransferase-1
MKKKIAILISGRGSNMQALVNACKNSNFPAEVILVLSNNINALGLEFAKKEGINTITLNHKDFISRQDFDQKMSEELEKLGVEIICLAGFMRLLSSWFVKKWEGRIINIHPSLLPNFKGAKAVEDAIKAGAKVSGCSVHFVNEEMDGGEIILQAQVAISSNDNVETLAEKILKEEHRIYPEALKIVINKL